MYGDSQEFLVQSVAARAKRTLSDRAEAYVLEVWRQTGSTLCAMLATDTVRHLCSGCPGRIYMEHPREMNIH